MNDSTGQQHNNDQTDKEISQHEWVRLYERGYILGTHQRSKQKANQQCNVKEQLSETHTLSNIEITALQSGFELGQNEPYPALKVNVRQRATTAFNERNNTGVNSK